jgi:hypothetical protein
VFIHSLKQFMDGPGGGFLPVNGSLPDMDSTTGLFQALQGIYGAKATVDKNVFTDIVRDNFKVCVCV